MRPDREQHLHDIKNLFLEKVDEKYRKGAEEHQETLLDKTDLLEEALFEAIDLFVYIATELQRRRAFPQVPEEPHTDD
jgi:hypothetical protein